MRVVIPVLTRLLSALCALAIVAFGGVLAAEVVANWIGNGFVVLPPDWPTQLRSTSWDAPIVRSSLLILLAAGIVLLLVAGVRRPPLTIDSKRDGIVVERHALESTLRRRLESIDGVSGSRVRVDNDRIRATVATTRRVEPESIRERAAGELSAFCALHELPPSPAVTLRVDGEA
jgi:hypothetical protein